MLNKITALEIATNPRDLVLTIAPKKEGYDELRVAFYRGEGHNFKLLLTADGVPDREKALEIMRVVLTASKEVAEEILGRGGTLQPILNPDNVPYHEGVGLSEADIQKIMEAFENGETTISTKEFLAI